MSVKKFRRILRELLINITIIISLDLMTLLIIDVFFNNSMNFVNNGFFKWCAMILCVLAVTVGGMLLHYGRKKKKK